MRYFFISTLIYVFSLGSVLQADWNSSFDKHSKVLIESISSFQGEYEGIYSDFCAKRKSFLKDLLLQKQISALPLDSRMVLLRPKEGIAIKKRSNNNIKEFFTWELSYLLGAGGFLIPSFPIEIAGKRVIIQRMEPFTFNSDKVGEFIPKGVSKISVEEYWKAHLQAYLLGLVDLVGQNIGFDILGRIRFFDMEYSLHYDNSVYRTARSFKTGFISQSLEWPQYRKALDQKTVASIRKFIRSMDFFESNLELYLSCRNAPVDIEGLLYRLEKVRSFPLEEGATFKDFYGFLFPQIAPGLDELSVIASDILQTEVDHGSALILVTRWLDRYLLSSSQKEAIENWMKRYVD